MPDLKPVFDDLRQRLSLHEDVFRRSVIPTDANFEGVRKTEQPAPGTSYWLLGAANDQYPDGLSSVVSPWASAKGYAERGWLATSPS